MAPEASVNGVGVIDDVRLRLRQIQRAASDLRRGVPVALGGGEPLALLAAETADADAVAEFAQLGEGPAVMLLAPGRAAAILSETVAAAQAVAVALPALSDRPMFYRAMADATVAQHLLPPDLVAVPPPAGAAAALALAKVGQLLPALLARRLPADRAERLARHAMIEVDPDAVLAYAEYEVSHLQLVSSAVVPLLDAPESRLVGFRSHASALEHFAVMVGRPEDDPAPLVRVHSCCFTGDLLGSMRCDCGEQLRGGIRRMTAAGSGVLLYLSQEGRGIGLINKLRAYQLQDLGLDTLDANRALGWGVDERNFLVGAAMLQALGINRIRLLTNNPEKMEAMAALGIEVVEREAHLFAPNGVNDDYLATKASRFGHMLD